MRLQCPNCDAEYEVDASAIPYEGRDVQCSNCGHGWFQAHADFEADYEVESALYDPPPPLPQGQDLAGAALPKRTLDSDAMRILREEVELEEAKRAAEKPRADIRAPVPAPETAQPAGTNQPTGDDAIESQLGDLVAADAPHVDDVLPMGAAQLTGPALTGPEMNGQFDSRQSEGRSTHHPADDLGDIEAALDAEQLAPPDYAAQDYAPMPRTAPRRVARLKGLGGDGAELAANTPNFAPLPPTAAPEVINDEPDRGGGNFAEEDTPRAADLRADLAAPNTMQRSGRRAGFYSGILAAIAALAGYILGPELASAVPLLTKPVAAYIETINSARDLVQNAVPQVLEFVSGIVQTLRGLISS
jgi:predicted Zn finger-like uncharacterized protein